MMHKLIFHSHLKIMTAVFSLNLIFMVFIIVTLNMLRNEKSDLTLFIDAISNFAIITDHL